MIASRGPSITEFLISFLGTVTAATSTITAGRIIGFVSRNLKKTQPIELQNFARIIVRALVGSLYSRL